MCRFMEFNAAFKECKGNFDVILNCVSARIDFAGMMAMLAPDGVAVQVRGARGASSSCTGGGGGMWFCCGGK
jgi:D-arabinose 1-dehydrogenase-like Zn-dependent alcohol dehydrogenase